MLLVLVDVWGQPYDADDGPALMAPPVGPVIPLPEPDRHPRAAGWPPFLKGFLARHKLCRGCRHPAKTGHHVKPYGKFPALELVESNIAPVCIACHFVICHANNWRTYVEDCLRRLDEHAASVAAALPIG